MDKLKLDRLGAGTASAFGSDDRHHGRLSDAFKYANETQDQREGRVNTLYDQVKGFSKDSQDFVMENHDKLLGGDQQMSDAELDTLIAKEADQRGWDQQTQDRIHRDAKEVMDMAMKSKTPAAASPGAD